MQDPHLPEQAVDGVAVDGKVIKAYNILEQGRFRVSPDGRLVEFHLDPPDPCEVPGGDYPFGTLAVALEKIAPSCHADQPPERQGPGNGPPPVPLDAAFAPVAEGCLDDPDLHPVLADVFPEQRSGDRFDSRNVVAYPCCPDAESPGICPDVKDPVLRPEIVPGVGRNFGDLPDRRPGYEKARAIPGAVQAGRPAPRMAGA